jgi:hypothetical protein
LALPLVFFLTLQCGFFNRRQHEKLLREKRESAGLPLSDDEVLNACLENGGDDKTDLPHRGSNNGGGFLRVDDADGGASRDPSEYDNGETESVPSLDDYKEHVGRFGAREKY